MELRNQDAIVTALLFLIRSIFCLEMNAAGVQIFDNVLVTHGSFRTASVYPKSRKSCILLSVFDLAPWVRKRSKILNIACVTHSSLEHVLQCGCESEARLESARASQSN